MFENGRCGQGGEILRVCRAADKLVLPIPANQSRIGRAIQREIGAIERRRQVAQAGIHRHHKPCARQLVGHRFKRQAREHLDIIDAVGEPSGARFFMWRPPGQTDLQTCLAHQRDKLAPVRFRPVFIIARGGVQEHDVTSGILRGLMQKMLRNGVIACAVGFT